MCLKLQYLCQVGTQQIATRCSTKACRVRFMDISKRLVWFHLAVPALPATLFWLHQCDHRKFLCRDDQGRTALHWVAVHGLRDVLELLLKAGDSMQKQQLEQASTVDQQPELPSLKLLQVCLVNATKC